MLTIFCLIAVFGVNGAPTDDMTAAVKKHFVDKWEMLKGIAAHPDQSEETLHKRYCGRKYVVDHHMQDDRITIDLNPNKINVDGIDCDAIESAKVKKIEEDLFPVLHGGEHPLDEAQTECFLKKFREGNFHHRFLTVVIIGSLDLSDELKAAQPEKVNAFYSDLATATGPCYH